MEGDLRRLRGDRDKKSVPHCIVHACMNGLFFLTTELHRSFSSYITFTTLLHHFYIIPSAHTSLSSSVPFVHHPLPERADSGFSGCAGNASRPRNKLRPRSPFSDGKNAGNRTSLAEWCEFPRYALARILMHAVKTEPARFWRVFGWFVACFTGFPSETRSEPLRRCTQRDVMVNIARLRMRYPQC